MALQTLLKGHITAVQLMFTGCTATCPIQGAIFADAASQLATAGRELRLLSISIDPLGDDAQALTAWLQRYGAQPQRWGAAVRFILPNGMGGTTDLVGRAIAQKLSDSLGQQVVVDNRPGSGGSKSSLPTRNRSRGSTPAATRSG